MITHSNIAEVALIAISCCFFIKDVSSIKCYQCSSAEDKKGEDNCGAYENFNTDRNLAVECNSDESSSPGTFCMRITQQGPRGFIWDGRWRQVIRQCSSVAEHGVTGVCNWGVLPNGVYWEKCYCSEDGCNSSFSIRPLYILLFLPLLTVLVIR